MSAKLADEYDGVSLAGAEVADAREIDRPENTLSHLTAHTEVLAIRISIQLRNLRQN